MNRVVLLIKDFDHAKQRLASFLSRRRRREIALSCAIRALGAAGPDAVVVAGSESVAELARRWCAEVVVETNPTGQSQAAYAGIARAISLGADSVLILSSDLPQLDGGAVRSMVACGQKMPTPAALAAPAIGRGGTNALFLAPPTALSMHFGADSLLQFEAEARSWKINWALYQSPALALDLDEPTDLIAAGYDRRGRKNQVGASGH